MDTQSREPLIQGHKGVNSKNDLKINQFNDWQKVQSWHLALDD